MILRAEATARYYVGRRLPRGDAVPRTLVLLAGPLEAPVLWLGPVCGGVPEAARVQQVTSRNLTASVVVG